MKNFSFYNPTKILFGKGRIQDIAGEIPKEAKILLTYGADIQAADAGGKTVLAYAARSGTLETIKYLLSQGIRFEQADKNDALIEAVRRYEHHHKPSQTESILKIKYLLAIGADINAKDEKGSTPLIYAASNADLVQMMMEQRAEFLKSQQMNNLVNEDQR